MKLSTQLKTWRSSQGLTQEQAAEKLGITLRTLENWEQDFSAPRGLARTTILRTLSKRLHPTKERK